MRPDAAMTPRLYDVRLLAWRPDRRSSHVRCDATIGWTINEQSAKGASRFALRARDAHPMIVGEALKYGP